MCMRTSHVRPYQQWNWGGDEIVHEPVIPASRTLPGGKRKRYPIDIREFLSIENNAVVRKHMETLIAELPTALRASCSSGASGSFDLRRERAASYMSRFHYIWSARRFDQWLFPEETLALGGGDCEDLAFLLAALLEASGISPYCIRVVLGVVVNHSGSDRAERWDHAWVVYQNEGGDWEIVEPIALVDEGRRACPVRTAGAFRALKKHPDVEYIPHFVFNRHHLWRVHTPEATAARMLADYVRERKDRAFWQSYKPRFAAKVHWSIFDEALPGMPHEDLELVKRVSFWVDTNVLRYDPRDHFDFAYIDQAWDLVNRRLATGDLADFALAAHAIGDFYAHSFYADFAPVQNDGSIAPFDPMHALPPGQLVYDFQPYAPLPGCQLTPDQAAAGWEGSLISGQWWRWYTSFPDDLENADDFSRHRCLPDHDMVAVDGPNPKPEQRHYTGTEYLRQYNMRRNAAIQHIRKTYDSWGAQRPRQEAG
jgi:hypothetical protein